MESNKIHILKKGQSSAEFDLSCGAKLRKLILTDLKTGKTHVVISDSTGDDNHLGGGSYLMYPWVNRLRSTEIKLKDDKLTVEPKFKDGNGLPLHGLFANTPRKVVQEAENILEVSTVDSYKPYDAHFPNFCEKFILEEDRLHIETVFDGDSSKKYPLHFAYGYHPYVGLDGKKIDDMIVKTNMHHCVVLNEKSLLPEVSEESLVHDRVDKHIKSGEVFKDTQLDHLFYFDERKAGLEEPVFQLIDPDTKLAVELTSNISNERKNVNLVYWQVYTPPDRQRIAIEPMTSPGDAFNIKYPEYLMTLKGEDTLVDGNFEIRLVNV